MMSATQQCNLYIIYGLLEQNNQHKGQNIPEPAAERPHLDWTCGGSTRGG